MKLFNPAVCTREIVHPLPPNEAHRRLQRAAERLGWRRHAETDAQLVYRVGMTWMSWGEIVTATLSASGVHLVSTCRCRTQSFDWGKNRLNCEALARMYDAGPLQPADAS